MDDRQRTSDLVEIQQLLAKYAVTITQGDIDGLISVFTPDGTYSAASLPSSAAASVSSRLTVGSSR